MFFSSGKRLYIDRNEEPRQFLFAGAPGTGKTQCISQPLDYIRRRGDVAVVLDAKLEFLPKFYDPDRGDWILSPFDERCPYWSIVDEVTGAVDASTVTRALYPAPKDGLNRTFSDWAVDIGARVLTKPPRNLTTRQFADIIGDENKLQPYIEGTPLANYLYKEAGPQRGAGMSALSKASFSLRLMPDSTENRPHFSIRQWAQSRKGWIFLPFLADNRQELRPLISLWVDMLLLRVMSLGPREDLPRVWFILDEVDTLQELPQLPTAMSEIRASLNTIATGCQNFGQLEERYGKAVARTMLGHPDYQFILRTNDGDSAEYLETFFGEIELRKYKENRSGGLFGGKDRNSFSGPDDERKPLIMASQIRQLKDLEGFFVNQGRVMKIKLPYIPRPDKQPKWIKREPPDPYESAATDPEQPFAQPSQLSHQISQMELDALLDA